MTPGEQPKQSPNTLIAGCCDATRALLKLMEPLADCTLQTCDGLKFRLHRTTLTQESRVMGCELPV